MEWLNRRGPCCSAFSLSRIRTHKHVRTHTHTEHLGLALAPEMQCHTALPQLDGWPLNLPSPASLTHTHNLIWERSGHTHTHTHTVVISFLRLAEWHCGKRNGRLLVDSRQFFPLLIPFHLNPFDFSRISSPYQWGLSDEEQSLLHKYVRLCALFILAPVFNLHLCSQEITTHLIFQTLTLVCFTLEKSKC